MRLFRLSPSWYYKFFENRRVLFSMASSTSIGKPFSMISNMFASSYVVSSTNIEKLSEAACRDLLDLFHSCLNYNYG